MNRDNCISCKEYAKLMRENAVRNHNGDVICSFELWEHLASIIEGFEVYRNPKDVAREIFAQVDGITDLLAVGDIGELEMYDLLGKLKKKYESEGADGVQY